MLFSDLVLQVDQLSTLAKLLDSLPHTDQRRILIFVLKLLSAQLPADMDGSTEDYPLIWAAAGVLQALVGTSQVRKDMIVAWLTDATGAGIGESCGIRRAAVAILAEDKEAITTVLEKSLNQFGDQLYTRHSPMLQQEGKL
jgi:telomere length regulation protein